jgi:hypothetical protein
MAFATKYSLTYKDVEGITWEIFFQEDGFSGSITTLTPGPKPLDLTWNGEGKYKPIVGSNADIQMVYESAVDDLYTEVSQSIKVLIDRDSTTIWTGFLSVGQYYRQFNQPKHYVTLTATDGLGELKNISFEDGSGDPYFNQQTEMTAISNILQKTGLQLGILDAVNIFDTNHVKGAAQSPLPQTYIYPERYWNEKNDERSNCDKVLKEILTKYGACVRQSNNWWFIVRINSYSLDNIYYRLFTYAGVYVLNSNYTSFDSIDSSLRYIYADQEFIKLTGSGSCQITQNPPRRTNLFKNGSFNSFTFDGSAFYYWSDSASVAAYSEDNDMLKMGSANSASIPTKYIESTVNIYNATSINISFDYTATYTGAPTYKTIVIQIYESVSAQYLTNAGWQGGVGYYSLTAGTSGTEYHIGIDVPETTSGEGYDRATNLRVRIYEFYNENVPFSNYFHMNNLSMTASVDAKATKLHSYINPITINFSKSQEVASGDSWRNDYFSSLFVEDEYFITKYSSGATNTSAWGITGDTTTDAPICEVLARQTVEGFRRSIDVFQGTLRGQQTTLSYLSFEDSNYKDEYGFNKRFFPEKIALNARRNEWSGEWIECPATYNDTESDWASSTYSSYTITANEIEVNSSSGAGTATLDSYTAVIYETVRVVLTLTDDGSSDLPNFRISGSLQTVTWGSNYLTYRTSVAGAVSFILGGDGAGETHNYTALIKVYYLTGI